MTVVTQPVQTPECRDVEAHLASLQGPAGYVRAPEITPEQFRWERGWVHAGGVPVSLLVSASCTRASALPPASRNGSVTPETIDGHRGWLLAEPALGYAEVTWNVNDSTQVTVAANGFHPASFGAVSGPTQEAQRLSDAELLAFARAAPTS
jgi:hypothetical protein